MIQRTARAVIPRTREREPPEALCAPGSFPAVEDWLDALEAMEDDERWTSLAYVAGQQLELDPDEVNGPLRRAVLLLAAGGDPQRELRLDSRAVVALADDLDTEPRPERLPLELASLRELGEGL